MTGYYHTTEELISVLQNRHKTRRIIGALTLDEIHKRGEDPKNYICISGLLQHYIDPRGLV